MIDANRTTRTEHAPNDDDDDDDGYLISHFTDIP